MKNKIYEYLKNKGSILILGFGREGKSTYNLIRSVDSSIQLGIADLKEITDEEVKNAPNVKFYIGDNYLDACYQYDVIIKGPGVIIKDYLPIDVRKKITCQTDLFVKFASVKTIGITGTKGKSTTTSLLYHILKNISKKAILMGNIGIPVFDKIDEIEEDSICVMELGCHQLEYMKNSPNISVILNIYEEHLDHYLSMDHYVNSKKNIYRYQNSNDYVLLGNNEYLKDKDIKSNVIYEGNLTNNCFYKENGNLVIDINSKKEIIPITNIKTQLQGEHNLTSILVCLTIISILNLDIEEAIATIPSFKGLPHRMEYIGTFNNISYYDDSIATSIPSVIFAINTLKNVDTVIIGGMDRGLNYTDLVNYLNKSSVTNILLLPDTNIRINKLFENISTNKNVLIVKDMVEAVKIAKEITNKGMSCLLSPAAASYGFYKNFEERGNHFQKLVKNN